MKPSIQLFAITAAALTLNVFTSCKYVCLQGSGREATESHKVDNFTKIDIEGGFKVTLRQDSSSIVNLTADDNLIKNVVVSVTDNKLHIYNKKSVCNSGEMILNIGVRNLDEIKASGAVELQTQGKLNTRDLTMAFSGASNVNMDLNAANVSTEGSGATEIHLTGQAASHKVDLSGSGKLYAYDFVAGTYNIITAGASECQINVLKTLKVNTSGASEIKYKGSPTDVSNKKSGASSIVKVD